jgi:hypothetical protein
MANPTSNFGWQMPTPVDLVTDLPADFEVFGQAVDSSLADLKGGTTGQILAKNSNTDMDFVWSSPNPGDITAVTAGTGITGGGTSGDVTVSFDQANFGGGQFAAGKNKMINGDFGIWQRGTSFSNPANGAYTADRYIILYNGTGSTRTYSQQTFTPGAAPVAGYEDQYFWRLNQSVAGSGGTFNVMAQYIEDVRTFAGQPVTFSFWAKADEARTLNANIIQNFGSGGSAEVVTAVTLTSSGVLTTSWQRYTGTITVPSVTGKTIGTSSFLKVEVGFPLNTAMTIDLWGMQLEYGSVATPFQTATGTIQGELAACQRYFQALSAFGCAGYASGAAESVMNTLPFVTAMRAQATITITSNGTTSRLTSAQIQNSSTTSAVLQIVASGAGFAGIYGGTTATASAEL